MIVGRTDNASSTRGRLWQYVPPFVVAFVVMVCVKSAGDYAWSDDAKRRERWRVAMAAVGGPLSALLLSVAMAGVGLNIRLLLFQRGLSRSLFNFVLFSSLASLRGVSWRVGALSASSSLMAATVGALAATALPLATRRRD